MFQSIEMADGNFHRLFWLVLLGMACSRSPEPPPTPSRMQPPTHQESLNGVNQVREEVSYWLEWGAIRLPLKQYASPNVYQGMVEVELNDFLLAIDQPLRLFQERRELSFELTSFSRPPFYRGSPWWFSYPDFSRGFFGSALTEKVKEGVKRGDDWHLNIFVPGDSLRVHSAVIHIRDPFAPYRPAVPVPEAWPDQEVFGFQVVNQKGRRPLLRVDTLQEKTRHVLELYRGNQSYHILHIPDFRTHRRLLTDDDELFLNRDFYRTDLLAEVPDWRELPEYTGPGSMPVLSWGRMKAAPSSENYLPAFFRQEAPSEPELRVGEQRLDILGFHLLIDSYRSRPRRWIATRMGLKELQKVLLTLPGGFTVYFDRLIVADETGRHYLFPLPFAFNVEEGPVYNLDIAVHPAGETSLVETTDQGGWQLRARSLPLPDLLSYLLGHPPGGVALVHFSEVPQLDVTFMTTQLSAEAGKQILLQKLQDRYRFFLDWRRARPLYYLERIPGKQGAAHPLPKVQDQLQLPELIRRLSAKEELLIIDRTREEAGIAGFFLPAGSWEEIEAQLASMGLALQREEEPPAVLVRPY